VPTDAAEVSIEGDRELVKGSMIADVILCLVGVVSANAHPSMTDSSGMIPLHYAVDRGHIECVKLVLNYPNSTLGLTGLKPALDLAKENDFPEISQLLEKARERGGRGWEGGGAVCQMCFWHVLYSVVLPLQLVQGLPLHQL